VLVQLAATLLTVVELLAAQSSHSTHRSALISVFSDQFAGGASGASGRNWSDR
jgi:hypothetical protein